MNIISAKYEILRPDIRAARQEIYRAIETAGRTCYKSEERMTEDSAAKFVRAVVKNGHEAMLEHASMTVRFTVDRGVSHEVVRHRLASFAQESTRYCNYAGDKFGNEITVIEPHPPKDAEWLKNFMDNWFLAMKVAENCYRDMVSNGVPPEWARSVLPNSLKTEIIVTMNMREWRHFLNLRAAGTTGAPHPQIAEVAVPLLKELQEVMPELFGDIEIRDCVHPAEKSEQIVWPCNGTADGKKLTFDPVQSENGEMVSDFNGPAVLICDNGNKISMNVVFVTKGKGMEEKSDGVYTRVVVVGDARVVAY